MSKSAVAAIVDARGGMRVVITERWRMHYHVAPGERLFVVPDFEVQEPIGLTYISRIVERAEQYAKKMLDDNRRSNQCK
jgi:hypothetical protein